MLSIKDRDRIREKYKNSLIQISKSDLADFLKDDLIRVLKVNIWVEIKAADIVKKDDIR